jgi:hypothetical protein
MEVVRHGLSSSRGTAAGFLPASAADSSARKPT